MAMMKTRPCLLSFAAVLLALPLQAEGDALAHGGREALLKEKFELLRCSNGVYSLFEAADFGDAVVTKARLHEGENPNGRDEMGNRPLHYAAASQSPEVVQLLLDAGADAMAKDGRGRLPLELTRNASVRQLLAFTHPQRRREMDADDMVRRGQIKSVRQAIEKEGVDPNAASVGGMGTLLHTAAEVGNVEMLRLLLELGASRDAHTQDTRSGALHTAARHGQARAIALLLKKGCNPMQMDSRGDSPLHTALRYGQLESVKALLPSYKKQNFNPEGGEQFPIYLAIDCKGDDFVRAFLKAGLDPNDKRFLRDPLPVYATLHKRLAAAKLLLAAGARQLTRDIVGGEDAEDEADEKKPAGGYFTPLLNKFLK